MAPSYHDPDEQTWGLQCPLDDHPQIPGSGSTWAMKEGEEKCKVGRFHNQNWLLTLILTQLLGVHCHCKRKSITGGQKGTQCAFQVNQVY